MGDGVDKEELLRKNRMQQF